jgi:hypothetical protein
MISVFLPTETSFLFICPGCFDVWARVEGTAGGFRHRYIPCEHHSEFCHAYGADLAGSLINHDCVPLDLLPPELLSREFRLHLQTTNKESHE